jgi:hypothetical protein
MSNLHPVFAGILAAHGLPQDQPPPPVVRADYIAAMIRCGWTIDSVQGYLDTDRGRADVASLWEMRKAIDPLGFLWFEFAHPAFRDDAL